ncbi:MAG: putative secreted hydrolase [Gammaproteobacteria bacterium]|jgi:predicted secreted hydrolase
MRCVTSKMRSAIVLIIISLALATINARSSFRQNSSATVADLLTEIDPPAGFSYAIDPIKFEFPSDHGKHPDFRSEWWYFTGNTATEDGHEFGFQFTIFRFALKPIPSHSQSPWRHSNIYMGHFAISDISAETFHAYERQARPALDMAGQQAQPLKIWIGDWSLEQSDGKSEVWHLLAKQNSYTLDIVLRADRPILLQGDKGLSKKSAAPGNASYYYSIPRLSVSGTIGTPETVHQVKGQGWYDHEWSTSALAEGQQGWDWFSLQLDDGRELMFYQIRDTLGQATGTSHGVILSNKGTQVPLDSANVEIKVQRYWRSPKSGARYPARWRIKIPEQQLDLIVTPRFADQEWRQNFTYWEGAVSVTGKSSDQAIVGRGYVELVGYDRGRN